MATTCDHLVLQSKHPDATPESLKILSASPILCKTKAFLTPLDTDQFKNLEKFYKLKKPFRNGKRTIKPDPTDFSNCVNLSDESSINLLLEQGKIKRLPVVVASGEEEEGEEGKVTEISPIFAYQFTEPSMSGFYIIPKMLSANEQKSLISNSLTNWCRPPANTNVRRLIELGHADYANIPDSETVLDENGERIRWANLGYKYDWTHRRYFESLPEVELPKSICNLSLKALEIAGLSGKFKNYNPDSCIINYYSEDTQFCGHIDDAELNARAFPIVTISIGLSAVFLHGKGKNCQDRKIAPEAIILNSGDVAIMSGDSRLCLHGVPRVIGGSFDEETFIIRDDKIKNDLEEATVNSSNFGPAEINYIKNHRLNINVRMYKGNVVDDDDNGEYQL